MADRRAAVFIHADQFRRQDGDRDRRWPIMQELKLSPSEFGLVGSSFYLLFALSAIVTGFVVNRVQTRWVLVAMGLIWALTQFPMMGAAGFGTLVACRIALGAGGEGPAAPVALHSAYKWFPNELRTLPTAVIVQGGGIGIMVALPLLNWVIVHYSWHWAFGVLGIAGLVWTAAWLAAWPRGLARIRTPAQPVRRRRRRGSAVWTLVFNPTMLASWCAAFGAQWGFVAGAVLARRISLIKGLGLTQGSIGLLGPLPAGASVVAMLAAEVVFAATARGRIIEPGGARYHQAAVALRWAAWRWCLCHALHRRDCPSRSR